MQRSNFLIKNTLKLSIKTTLLLWYQVLRLRSAEESSVGSGLLMKTGFPHSFKTFKKSLQPYWVSSDWSHTVSTHMSAKPRVCRLQKGWLCSSVRSVLRGRNITGFSGMIVKTSICRNRYYKTTCLTALSIWQGQHTVSFGIILGSSLLAKC